MFYSPWVEQMFVSMNNENGPWRENQVKERLLAIPYACEMWGQRKYVSANLLNLELKSTFLPWNPNCLSLALWVYLLWHSFRI